MSWSDQEKTKKEDVKMTNDQPKSLRAAIRGGLKLKPKMSEMEDAVYFRVRAYLFSYFVDKFQDIKADQTKLMDLMLADLFKDDSQV